MGMYEISVILIFRVFMDSCRVIKICEDVLMFIECW